MRVLLFVVVVEYGLTRLCVFDVGYSEYVKVFYTNVYNCVLGSVRVRCQKQFRHLYSFSVCINLYESETLRGHTDMICVIGLGDITKNCLKGFLSFFQKQPLIKVFVNLNFFSLNELVELYIGLRIINV